MPVNRIIASASTPSQLPQSKADSSPPILPSPGKLKPPLPVAHSSLKQVLSTIVCTVTPDQLLPVRLSLLVHPVKYNIPMNARQDTAKFLIIFHDTIIKIP